MKASVIEMDEEKGKIIFEDITPSFINTIRRVMVSRVPKMAVDTVELHLGSIRGEDGKEYESVTPLFDEIVAHRIAMVPIPTDIDEFNFPEECSCGGVGCEKCQIVYRLDKKGPGMVYSGDIEPLNHDYVIKIPDIPIVKLEENQAIMAYVIAKLGTAKQHAKWLAALAVGYKYYPKISIDNKKCDAPECKACVDICPKNVLEIKRNKLTVVKLEDCTMCNSCVEVCDSGAVKVEGDKNKIMYRYETDGSYDAKGVLIQTLKEGEKLFKDLKKAITSV